MARNSVRPDKNEFSVKEFGNLSLGGNGAITLLSTNGAKGGKFCAITALEDSTFTTLLEFGKMSNGLVFDSGSGDFEVGDTISVPNTDGGVCVGSVKGVYYTVSNTDGVLHVDWGDDYTDSGVANDQTIAIIRKANGGDAVEDAGTTNGTNYGDNAGTLGAKILKAGATIFGKFYKVDLATGSVRLYKA